MNLKNNKGYVGVDVSIAVIILLILVPVIMGIVFNINRTQSTADVKAGALNIAVNSIEASKGIEVSQLTADKIFESLNGTYSGKIQDTSLDEDEKSDEDKISDANLETFGARAVITDKASYKLKIKVADYKGDGVIKTVKATVFYKVGNKKESIDLSTVVK